MTGRLLIEVAPVDRLAESVARLGLPKPVVLGLPPGGLLTASRVARVLQVPLDMLLPRHADAPIRIEPGIVWPALAGRSAVIVDDGNAEPLDWHAALASLRPLQPDCLAIVVPALSEAIERALASEYKHLFGRPVPLLPAYPAATSPAGRAGGMVAEPSPVHRAHRGRAHARAAALLPAASNAAWIGTAPGR